ncbi:MAG: hypothetical protein AAB563_00405 [Patescibacteria group bacterium]
MKSQIRFNSKSIHGVVAWKVTGTLLWAVFANWNDWNDGDNWKLNAYPIENANDWNADNQFLSGDSLLFSYDVRRSF